METVQEKTYENIYYLLWEAAQRYQKFTQFRVIGKSHDDRMIPMLEIGTGDLCIFCIAGFSGTDGQMSDRLAETAVELCRNYECGWTVQEFYEVRKLLDQTRLCIIPVVNPDGYEICRKGYGTVRNPIFRQMLKMQDVPCDEFVCNARGSTDTHLSGICKQGAPGFLQFRKKDHLLQAGTGIFCWSERLSPGASSEKMYKRKTGTIFYGL